MTQPSNQTEIILYTTTDGEVKVDTIVQNETIWLTKAQMAELHDAKVPAISKHLENIFESGEQDKKWLFPFWNIPLNAAKLNSDWKQFASEDIEECYVNFQKRKILEDGTADIQGTE